MRLMLPLALALAAISCGGGGSSDALDAPGEVDALVTFDAVEAADATEADGVAPSLCTERFHAEIPSAGPVRAPLVGADGTLYVVSGDLAMGLTDEGLERWRKTVPAEQGTCVVLGNPALLGDAIVVGTTQGLLVKLSAKDGEERWRFPHLQEKVLTAPVQVGNRILVAGTDTLFYVREPAANQAEVDHPEGLTATPLQPVVAGEHALVTTGGRVLRRAADGTGDEVRAFADDQGTLTSAPAPLGDGRWVVGGDWKVDGGASRGVVVLDPATGTAAPVAVAGLVDGPSMLLVTANGRVLGLTPAGEGVVIDLGLGTGERFALGGQSLGYPLVGNDGVWYLAVGQGEAGVLLSARTVTAAAGEAELWSVHVDGQSPGPLGMTLGGTVLFPVGMKLHGYRCGTSTLAPSPWPKFQGDGANSGVF